MPVTRDLDRAVTRERARREVLRRFDMLFRGEIDAFAVERTDAGNVLVKVSPRLLCEKIGELAK